MENAAIAAVFEEMAEEETTHRARLIDLHKRRFGDRSFSRR